ncbi:DUF4123 domain-containing protein [Marinobacter nanhaiticus D15-8W]|uniref:DUF4123 domain-containing protein n=1 Tax=Marinobacter nanhaiticus D15-8W TaxID=626887 RepID=N6WWP1_9GAMM|nr:DUF4123 domain-containing protein [Marinobacter nanhaiticus]ENO15492.1 DUF4123 domain-containing protein [Marinobacter nanhaiticus D15-8W]BES73659.1 DUF4123 domain-containing protein [Marinobacter nanhaiticus D15-8W]
MGSLVNLPGSGKTFLLIDGAKVNNLPQVIYHEIETPHCDALYRETELADLLEISPWLVETEMESSLALKCFEEWMHRGATIVIRADRDFEEVINHLRGLLTAKLGSGDEVVFRFYDPEIARHLLRLDPRDAKLLMGPCSLFAIQDRRTGEWEHFHNDQSMSKLESEVFTIREEHQVAMERAAGKTALRKLELHVANYFPHLLQKTGIEEQQWEVVSALVKAAKARGLYSARDIALYINTVGWLGHHAFEDIDVQSLWNESPATPGKAIARIAEFAERKSTEGLAHG